MSEIEQIRQRDRNVIARIGDPDNDPLLRAEMDRRFLLDELVSMKRYGADLVRQRAEHDIARTEAEAKVARLESDVQGQEKTIQDRDREIYRLTNEIDQIGDANASKKMELTLRAEAAEAEIEELKAERQRILGVVYALAPINVVQVVQEATR